MGERWRVTDDILRWSRVQIQGNTTGKHATDWTHSSVHYYPRQYVEVWLNSRSGRFALPIEQTRLVTY